MMSMSVLILSLVLEEILLVFLTPYAAGSWFLTDTLSWIDICSFYFLPSGIFITREFWNLLKALPESIVITLPLISYGLWTYYCMFIINIIDLLVLNHSCIPEIRPFFPFLKILVEFFFQKFCWEFPCIHSHWGNSHWWLVMSVFFSTCSIRMITSFTKLVRRSSFYILRSNLRVIDIVSSLILLLTGLLPVQHIWLS